MIEEEKMSNYEYWKHRVSILKTSGFMFLCLPWFEIMLKIRRGLFDFNFSIHSAGISIFATKRGVTAIGFIQNYLSFEKILVGQEWPE